MKFLIPLLFIFNIAYSASFTVGGIIKEIKTYSCSPTGPTSIICEISCNLPQYDFKVTVNTFETVIDKVTINSVSGGLGEGVPVPVNTELTRLSDNEFVWNVSQSTSTINFQFLVNLEYEVVGNESPQVYFSID